MHRKIILFTVVAVLCLLLSSCGHKHEWNDANCTTPKTCKECGETEGSALGHDWKNADCTTPKTCARCGATEGEALSHDWLSKEVVEPTCNNQGYTKYVCRRCNAEEYREHTAALGHDWIDATCTEAKKCSRCGATEGVALGHDTTGLSCEEGGICPRCDTELAALGHAWDAATCTIPKTCSRCGKTEGDALGHSAGVPVRENETKPTCTDDGQYDEVTYCSSCHEELLRETRSEQALGHQVNNGVCSRCGEKITVVLFEDSTVKITFKNVKTSSYSSDRIEAYYYVENKTEKTLLIQADAVAFNGYCFCDLVISDRVSAGSTGTVNVSIMNFDRKLVDINNIVSVGGQFRIIDDATWKSYDALFTNVKLDATGIGTAPSDFTNENKLYEDDSCAIYFRSISKSRYSDDRADMLLYLLNKTKKTLLIQSDTISINGFSFSSLIMSDPVLPETIGLIEMSIEDFDFEAVDINSITQMGGQLRIIDDASWKTYKAKFNNVEIK